MAVGVAGRGKREKRERERERERVRLCLPDSCPLFVTFGTFVSEPIAMYLAPAPPPLPPLLLPGLRVVASQRKNAFAPVIYGFDYPRTMAYDYDAGNLMMEPRSAPHLSALPRLPPLSATVSYRRKCLQKAKGCQASLPGNKTKRTRAKGRAG